MLIDRYLADAIEVDVDCLSDGRDTFIAGIMEHIEEAGIHSGDSACSLPAHSLASSILVRLEKQTRDLALALKVVGLMNVQYAVKGREIYILEVNPRASRTVPFVAKVIGRPIAGIAARVMNGEPLASFKLKSDKLAHVAVKEAVFPFARFPGVDTILGPEMRSTGEVMGIDRDYAMAFAKSQLGAGNTLPLGGAVFVSLRDDDKEGILGAMRDLGRPRISHPRHARHQARLGGPRHPLRAGQQGVGGPAPHRGSHEERRGAPCLQYDRRCQGARRFQGYSAYCLALPHSLLYNFSWCAGGNSGHQGARSRDPHRGAAAVIFRSGILGDAAASRPEQGWPNPTD